MGNTEKFSFKKTVGVVKLATHAKPGAMLFVRKKKPAQISRTNSSLAFQTSLVSGSAILCACHQPHQLLFAEMRKVELGLSSVPLAQLPSSNLCIFLGVLRHANPSSTLVLIVLCTTQLCTC